MFFFSNLRVLVWKLASPFGHPTQISSQVQLASTCDYLAVRLTRALRYRPQTQLVRGISHYLIWQTSLAFLFLSLLLFLPVFWHSQKKPLSRVE